MDSSPGVYSVRTAGTHAAHLVRYVRRGVEARGAHRTTILGVRVTPKVIKFGGNPSIEGENGNPVGSSAFLPGRGSLAIHVTLTGGYLVAVGGQIRVGTAPAQSDRFRREGRRRGMVLT